MTESASQRPRRCLRAIGVAALSLWLLGVTVDLGRTSLDGSALGRTVVACFDLDAEQTITAWFSSSLLLTCAGLWLIGGLRARRTAIESPVPWFVAATLTALLSMDETVGLHERLGNAVHRSLPGLGLETFAWVIPGACFALLAGTLLVRFLRRQPRSLRRGILLAAGCYFGGAIGVEALGAWIATQAGKASPWFALEVWIEEGLELAGACLCAQTLARHLFTPGPAPDLG